MASIYLNEKKNPKEYQRCYKELVEISPNVETFTLLGDSYLELHEVDRAISIYQKAFELYPHAGFLASKIAQAMILNHEYVKAVEYFKTAVGSASPESKLYLDLATLYYELNEMALCQSVIALALNHPASMQQI